MHGDPDFWPRLLLGALATWRLAHLLAHEDGPAGIVARARAALGASAGGRLLDCFACVSLWVAAPIAWWVAAAAWDAPWIWLALSGAAGLAERAAPREPALQAWPVDAPHEEASDELLRARP